MTSQEYNLPFEMIIEIARSEWRAWGKLGVCCKALHSKLKGDDPYALFTTKQIINPELDEVWAGWYTRDGVRMRTVVNSDLIYLLIQYRDGRALMYRYAINYRPSTTPGRRFDVIGTSYYIDIYGGVNTIDDICRLVKFDGDRLSGKYTLIRQEDISKEQWKDMEVIYSHAELLK
ncbi:hypothetical protein F-VV57_0504 [Faustovirus]|nr:hypothetical protein F-VV57_0504 [Faustovirus]QJX73772.1 hypothetical protein F-VV63_0506 [Faustovirus]